MRIDVHFDIPTARHYEDAAKLYWQSRGCKTLTLNDKEALFLRGEKGYKWVGINPFKYHFSLKCTFAEADGRIKIHCEAGVEKGFTNNVWRDVLVKEEFALFERYMQSYAAGRPFQFPCTSELKFKRIWIVYLLNVIPGLGLAYAGTYASILLGVAWFILSVIKAFNIYVNQPIHFVNYYAVEISVHVFLWLVCSIWGGMLVQKKNFEKAYLCDQE